MTTQPRVRATRARTTEFRSGIQGLTWGFTLPGRLRTARAASRGRPHNRVPRPAAGWEAGGLPRPPASRDYPPLWWAGVMVVVTFGVCWAGICLSYVGTDWRGWLPW